MTKIFYDLFILLVSEGRLNSTPQKIMFLCTMIFHEQKNTFFQHAGARSTQLKHAEDGNLERMQLNQNNHHCHTCKPWISITKQNYDDNLLASLRPNASFSTVELLKLKRKVCMFNFF